MRRARRDRALVSSRPEESSIQANWRAACGDLPLRGYDLFDDEHGPVTNWRSVAAAVDDTTAVLDSCSLKHRRRAYFTVYARRSIRQGREEGAQNESTYVCE